MMMNWDFSQGCLMTLILVVNMLIIDHDRGWGAQAKCCHSFSNMRRKSFVLSMSFEFVLYFHCD